MNRASLDRAWPNHRNLDSEVIKPPRLEPRQQCHLSPGLHLEHPNGISPAEHVVHTLLVSGQGVELPLLAQTFVHKVEGVPDGFQNAETQQVKLHQPHPLAIIFVPLQNGPLLPASGLDRDHFGHRTIGEHHASGVNTEVTRQSQGA